MNKFRFSGSNRVNPVYLNGGNLTELREVYGVVEDPRYPKPSLVKAGYVFGEDAQNICPWVYAPAAGNVTMKRIFCVGLIGSPRVKWLLSVR